MDKRTVSSAHERIDGLEKEVIAIKTEVKIQFKDLFMFASNVVQPQFKSFSTLIQRLIQIWSKLTSTLF